MRSAKQTRFDVSDPIQFRALAALLGREGAAEQAVDGLRRLSQADVGAMPVALQLRRSRSALEQEGSLRSQVLGAVDVLTRLGGRRVVAVHVFADTTGGKLWQRGFLDQVVSDARDGVMRELWHLDSKRLGRMPRRQMIAYLEALDAAGVRARNLSCPDAADDLAGDIKRILDAEQNHNELLDKAQTSVERTLHRHLERGIHSGPAPYGMAIEVRRQDDPSAPVRLIPRNVHFRRAKYEITRLVPGDPTEVRTVEAMVSIALDERVGYRGICERLNHQGVPSPGGSKWNANTVRKILHNAAYVGDATHFVTAESEYMSLGLDGRPAQTGTMPRRRPRDQVPTKANVHLGIIPRDRWDALQRELDRRETGKVNQHTLRGPRVVPPATCSHCGRAMKWYSAQDRLVCSGYLDAGLSTCRSYRCGATALAHLLWRTHAQDVAGLLGTTDLAGKIRGRVEALLATERQNRNAEAPVDMAALRKRISALEAEADRLVTSLSAEALQLIDGRLRRLATEKKELERQVATAAAKPKAKTQDRDSEVDAAMERLEVLAQDPATIDPDSLRAILATAVRSGSLVLRWRRREGMEGRVRGAYVLEEVAVDLIDPMDALTAAQPDAWAEAETSLRTTGRRGRAARSWPGP